MSHSLLGQLNAVSTSNLSQKRRRIPSQYADQIDDLKKQHSRWPKRQKNNRTPKQPSSNSEQTFTENQDGNKKGESALQCKLPSGRKLKLSIIIKKNLTLKSKKAVSSQVRIKEPPQPEPVSKTPCDQTENLLAKFLLAAQELNQLEQNERQKIGTPETNNLGMLDETGSYRRNRIRCEKDSSDRMIRFQERVSMLDERFQNLSKSMIQI